MTLLDPGCGHFLGCFFLLFLDTKVIFGRIYLQLNFQGTTAPHLHTLKGFVAFFDLALLEIISFHLVQDLYLVISVSFIIFFTLLRIK